MPQTARITPPQPELDKSWRRVLRVWWSLIWRLMLMQLFFMTLVVYSTEVPFANYPILRETINALSILAVFPFGIWALRAVINKNFGTFRLSLMPLNPADSVEAKADSEMNGALQQEKEDKKHAKSSK